MIVFAREEGPKPEDAKPGPRVKFLGAQRETAYAERKTGDQIDCMLAVRSEEWIANVFSPQQSWEVLLPVVEKILSGAKLVRKE
jgi:hypothetical protein